jgi:hypothetical protein
MTAVLDLHQAASPEGGSDGRDCFAPMQPGLAMTGRISPKDVGECWQWQAFYNLKQVLFSFVVDHEVSKPS